MHVLAVAEDAGADDLLPKSFVITALMTVVACMARHRIQARNEKAKAALDPTKVGWP